MINKYRTNKPISSKHNKALFKEKDIENLNENLLQLKNQF